MCHIQDKYQYILLTLLIIKLYKINLSICRRVRKMGSPSRARTWDLWTTIPMFFPQLSGQHCHTFPLLYEVYPESRWSILAGCESYFLYSFMLPDAVLNPLWDIKCHRVRKMHSRTRAWTHHLQNTVPILIWLNYLAYNVQISVFWTDNLFSYR